MYIALLDEAGHTGTKNFTVCGLTAVETDKVSILNESIEDLRATVDSYGDTDLLKFQSASRPDGCDTASHTAIKSDVIAAGKAAGVTFIGYGYFNSGAYTFDSDRNRLFGFNTLIGKFDKFFARKR